MQFDKDSFVEGRAVEHGCTYHILLHESDRVSIPGMSSVEILADVLQSARYVSKKS